VSEQPYPVIESRVDARGPEFRASYEANTAAVEKLRVALREATVGGGGGGGGGAGVIYIYAQSKTGTTNTNNVAPPPGP